MTAWLLLLSLLSDDPSRTPMVVEHRLENTSQAECLRLGNAIADRFERSSPDRKIIVECVRAGKRT